MKRQFQDIGELTTSLQTYMSSFSPYERSSVDWRFSVKDLEGHFVTQTLAPGFSVSFVEATLAEVFRFNVKSSQLGLVEIGINLNGVMESKISGYRQEIDGFPGQSYISRIDGEMKMKSLVSPQKKMSRLEVHFSKDLFRKLCDESECPLTSYLKTVTADRGNAFTYCSTVLPKSHEKTAWDIVNSLSFQGSDVTKELCREFAQGTILHLGKGMQAAGSVISSRDIEKIRLCRDILEENLASPPSLKEMAGMLGLNDYKLKAGFRQAYGTTYHKTITELRMEKARMLLQSKDRSVSETALEVGYGNLGDFGIAFKKRFGMTPRMVLFGAV